MDRGRGSKGGPSKSIPNIATKVNETERSYPTLVGETTANTIYKIVNSALNAASSSQLHRTPQDVQRILTSPVVEGSLRRERSKNFSETQEEQEYMEKNPNYFHEKLRNSKSRELLQPQNQARLPMNPDDYARIWQIFKYRTNEQLRHVQESFNRLIRDRTDALKRHQNQPILQQDGQKQMQKSSSSELLRLFAELDFEKDLHDTPQFQLITIENLDPTVDEEGLRSMFGELGPIAEVNIFKDVDGHDIGLASIIFLSDDADTAERAAFQWNGVTHRGRRLRVNTNLEPDPDTALFDQHGRPDIDSSTVSNQGILVRNIPIGISKDTLHLFFREFGKIVEIRLYTFDAGTFGGKATILYDREASARAAIKKMHQTKVLDSVLAVASLEPRIDSSGQFTLRRYTLTEPPVQDSGNHGHG